jgi:hypothetical protein
MDDDDDDDDDGIMSYRRISPVGNVGDISHLTETYATIHS